MDSSKRKRNTEIKEVLILVVEDDSIMREAMAEWLTAAGYIVRTAADGSAGLSAVRDAEPALVVTDVYMPGMGGAHFIVEMKQANPKIPILAISGRFNSGRGLDADAVIALGAVCALAKPFKRGDLLRVVASLLAPSSL